MKTPVLIVSTVAAAVVLTAAAIYLTPLKYIDVVSPPINEVDPKTFYAEYEADPSNYVFLDVRTAQQYDLGHAPGSVSVPIANLYNEHAALPRSGKQIALMCSNGVLAAVAYGYLQDWGFSNLIHIQGGLDNWIAEGLPVATGPGATSTPSISQ